jgi:hypothetical protein
MKDILKTKHPYLDLEKTRIMEDFILFELEQAKVKMEVKWNKLMESNIKQEENN